MDINKIKLIVWDLDETLWTGTLSEGDIILPLAHIQLIKDLTDCGIINSISSKNEYEPTMKKLIGLGIWDFFVSPSINWESKGTQLKNKIESMALRPANVLFIDDNLSNQGEAKHYLPDILACGPEIIPDIIAQVAKLSKNDLEHKRLKQYKILEEKNADSKKYSCNEEFLYDSCIQVRIHKDCLTEIERLHELLLRSNQLNYTKKRISADELKTILVNPAYDCGYITSCDRYGDYGIVGFYACLNGELEHFFFSCRTMGQKIEQWVYAYLGFPKLEVVGEVRTQLNKTEQPGWINNNEPTSKTRPPHSLLGFDNNYRILLKGPCDLSRTYAFIKDHSDKIDTEFTYVSCDNTIIEAHNHSAHIEGLYTYSDTEKEEIIRDCPFVDPPMLNGSFFTNDYDMIFLSTLIEASYLIYQKKGSSLRVVYRDMDLTNQKNWEALCSGHIYTGGGYFYERVS